MNDLRGVFSNASGMKSRHSTPQLQSMDKSSVWKLNWCPVSLNLHPQESHNFDIWQLFQNSLDNCAMLGDQLVWAMWLDLNRPGIYNSRSWPSENIKSEVRPGAAGGPSLPSHWSDATTFRPLIGWNTADRVTAVKCMQHMLQQMLMGYLMAMIRAHPLPRQLASSPCLTLKCSSEGLVQCSKIWNKEML